MTNWSAERLVKEHEGRRLSVYVDSRGFRTVGYGHRLEGSGLAGAPAPTPPWSGTARGPTAPAGVRLRELRQHPAGAPPPSSRWGCATGGYVNSSSTQRAPSATVRVGRPAAASSARRSLSHSSRCAGCSRAAATASAGFDSGGNPRVRSV